MAYARSKIGAPYVWGGTGPWGYDCSGITYMAYKQVGITLPRTSAGQYEYSGGRKVPMSQAQVGDLVFWASGGRVYHVALYAGSGTIVGARTYGTPLSESPIYTWSNVLPYVVRVL